MKNRKWAIWLLVLVAIALTGLVSCEKRVRRGLVKKKCVECHQEVAAKYKEAQVVHNPVVSDSCESCHRPHGVVGGAYLKVNVKQLCYSCHKRIRNSSKENTSILLPKTRHASAVTILTVQ